MVLDAATGEIVFDFPIVSREAQRERLGSVLNLASAPKGIGQFGWARIAGNQLLIYRTFNNERRSYAYDVYDMQKISNDAQPDYRIPANWTPRNRCASRDYPRTLAERHDRLVYVSVRR